VIVGAGFSGALTAVNLLRLAPPEGLRVVLVNKSGRMARGIAYGTRSAEHVLNVPAGNMSALADDPEDFLRFCRWSDPGIEPSSFVSRRLYGTYLEALLAAAEHGGGEHAQLEREVGEVVSMKFDPVARRARVVLDDGRSINADHVVLAFGHFPPADPTVSTPGFYASDRYVRDPWAPGALRAIDAGESLLLLGSGLTAVDVALALRCSGEGGPVVCVSRRGLTPNAHRVSRGTHSSTDIQPLLQAMGRSTRSYLRALRRHVHDRTEVGDDWRDVLASLRPHTPALWQRLSEAERARFLRHVQPYWDVLRHRCAPEPFARYSELREAGQVRVVAARILAYEEDGEGVLVTLRPRGKRQAEQMRVSRVVNCTGPDSDLRRSRTPLVRDLLAHQLIQPDALGLGIAVDEHHAVLDGSGRASPVLHYIGPLLRARDWEATAVPELREHARRLAARLLA
jgi:uncharacterized NAD(P)/FAD-binding protein YdhS